jgi:HPt (histidine-containing phosphotransfer) domain-containing protein
MLIERMRNGPACRIAGCAHTLKGSAQGIGAWRIARASERVEFSAGRWGSGFKSAMDELVQSVDEARAEIKRMQQVN